MGHPTPIDIKLLAFKVLERKRTVPQLAPMGANGGTAHRTSSDISSPSSNALEVWSSEQTTFSDRFGQSHTILFPLIGKQVSTPRGPGRLETVYAKRCEVVLDSDPGKMSVFTPAQIGVPI